MDTRLFEQYASAIRAAGGPDDSSLRMAADGQIEIFYAPFEAVNPLAKLVLVGITPGRVQAANALSEARRQLAAGAPHCQAMRKAKEFGAFSGPMRANLSAMLDHIGLDRWLGIGSCKELFDTKPHLLQTASVLQFPVFVNGENYNGNPDPLRTPLLRRNVMEYFAKLGAQLPDAVFIPLGPVPTKVMEALTKDGSFRNGQVLSGLPHPSGANAERIQYFLGRKDSSLLSVKTNAALLDSARRRLQGLVSKLT